MHSRESRCRPRRCLLTTDLAFDKDASFAPVPFVGHNAILLRGTLREQSSHRSLWLVCPFVVVCFATLLYAQGTPVLQNTAGLRLLVAEENTAPTLRIVLPGHPDSDRAIEVLFPEHVTVRKHGGDEG